MNAREERGLVIAALCKLRRQKNSWLVPSQSSQQIYTVNTNAQTCTCPDHQERGVKCKHMYAVEFTIKREVDTDGNITETKTMTFTEKVTVKRDWSVYNEAQQHEKERLLALLFDLTRGIPNQERPAGKRGRNPVPTRDMVFAATFKVYSMFSTRRFQCDLEDAWRKGYLSRLTNSICVSKYLESPALTPVLHSLVEQAALPLRSIETVFAPDSTGFSCSRFVRWFDEKYGLTRSGKDWCKAHAMTGTKTHCITAVEIHERDAADYTQFGPLMDATAKNFKIKEVCADKAYLGRSNLETVDKYGGVPYIPFKSNSSIKGEAGTLWEKMYLYYNFNREDFERHYHQRSQAETVFSMVKAKFQDNVMSKTQTAMKNEVLCKFLCHNICCVIMSQVELGIETVFWKDGGAEPVVKLLPMQA
jgi:transposase